VARSVLVMCGPLRLVGPSDTYPTQCRDEDKHLILLLRRSGAVSCWWAILGLNQLGEVRSLEWAGSWGDSGRRRVIAACTGVRVNIGVLPFTAQRIAGVPVLPQPCAATQKGMQNTSNGHLAVVRSCRRCDTGPS